MNEGNVSGDDAVLRVARTGDEGQGGLCAPNPSRALQKFSEIYDRIAFAAVGRYNEFENLRKAGIRYADMTGFQYDRQDVTARGLANWYAQLLGTIFTESNKPFEVEIVVAEVAATLDADQIYRITFDGSVSEERGFVVMGGQADRVAAVLKDSYAEGMTLTAALGVALTALAGQGNGERQDVTASQLEVAVLDRGRTHRSFRRLTGARLEALLADAGPGKQPEAAKNAEAGEDAEAGTEAKAGEDAGPAQDAEAGKEAKAGEDAGPAQDAEAGKDAPAGGSSQEES
jgi:proteasome alpha subunit